MFCSTSQNRAIIDPRHESVLANSVMQLLSPKENESVLDLTVGLGGHSSLFLEATSPNGMLTGTDADRTNLRDAEKNLAQYSDRIELLNMNFVHIEDLSDRTFDIIFADLGVSSPHFDDTSRGFSFRHDAPLDMRFNRESGKTAAQFIASASEKQLIEVLSTYGELPPIKLARTIHQRKPETTFELSECVKSVFGFKANAFLPQVFQAFRMRVNHEIDALQAVLTFAPQMLKPQGRLGIISFHSLEDRLVKKGFASLSTPEINEVTGAPLAEQEFHIVTKKPASATQDEVDKNPRSRSAKFRVLMKA